MANLCFFSLIFFAQQVPWNAGAQNTMPDWAVPHLDWAQYDIRLKNKLEDLGPASMWRILDESVVTYLGQGELMFRRRILQVVLKHSGKEAASEFRIETVEDVTKTIRLNGWHLLPNGSLKHLQRDQIVTRGRIGARYVDQKHIKTALFEGVTRGSLIAFESLETVKGFLGPVCNLYLLAKCPIRERSIQVRVDPKVGEKVTPRIVPQRLDNWSVTTTVKPDSITFSNLPGVRSEALVPRDFGHYPFVFVGFLTESSRQYESWDHMAKWVYAYFSEASLGVIPPATQSPIPQEALETLYQRLCQRLTYRQLYLSPTRGWVPDAGKAVFDRAFGDCKDFVACLLFLAAEKSITVYPALSGVYNNPYVEPSDTPNPGFNHVIGAIPLCQSLGYPAEIETHGQRYLLCDPTSRNTRLGWLPSAHKRRQVLICTPSGARWAQIPIECIETELVALKLSGKIGEKLDFEGKMEILDRGNVLGLRRAAREGNPVEVQRRIRRFLELQGSVDMVMSPAELLKTGDVSISSHVIWPGFFRHDGNGLRITKTVLQAPQSLAARFVNRQQPIEIPDWPEIRWQMNLEVPFPMRPLEDSFEWANDTRRIRWHALMEKNRLDVLFERQGQYRRFSGAELKAGIRAWSQYSQAYEKLWSEIALFQRETDN